MKLYFPVINTLRAVAAIFVVFYHFIGHSDINVGQLIPTDDVVYQIAKFGKNSVYMFFVISGLVMPITMFKSDFKLNNFGTYFIKRWLRIEIPYFASMLLYLLIGYVFAVYNDIPLNFNLTQFANHISHTIAFTEHDWYNIIYWTLAIEFQFYILIALLFPLLSNKSLLVSLGSIIVFASTVFVFTDNRFLFHFAPIFSLGMLLFLIKTNKIKPVLGQLVALLIGGTIYFIHDLPIAFFALLAFATIQHLSYATKLLDWIGDKSYSIYLIHGAIGGNVMYFSSRYVESYAGRIGLVLASLAVSFVAAYVFWLVFEKTSHRWSRNFGKKRNKNGV